MAARGAFPVAYGRRSRSAAAVGRARGRRPARAPDRAGRRHELGLRAGRRRFYRRAHRETAARRRPGTAVDPAGRLRRAVAVRDRALVPVLVTPPTLRLIGLAALRSGSPAACRRCDGAWRRCRGTLSRTIVALVSFGVVLAAFPIAGLRWHLVWYLKIAVAAGEIVHGLTGLGNILVPYDGFDHRVTLVVMLGAAVLLLDAGAVLAFAPRQISDARRATAALPLIALAVVPSTLVHPAAPSLQGLLLFGLVAFFVWGERLRFDGGRAALALLATAGLAGVVVAPVITAARRGSTTRSGAAGRASQHLAAFQWNQTYGPLRWPQKGTEVLSVRAKTGHYWKAENLDDFDGTAWVQGPPAALPVAGAAGGGVRRRALAHAVTGRGAPLLRTVRVTIEGMRTTVLIGAGQWTLSRGSRGQSPRPGHRCDRCRPTARSGRHLPARVLAEAIRRPAQRRDGAGYPWGALRGYRRRRSHATVARRSRSRWRAPWTPPSHRARRPGRAVAVAAVQRSPYSRADALAQRLASDVNNELQFVRQVMAYLSTGHGFRYDQAGAAPSIRSTRSCSRPDAASAQPVLRGDGVVAAHGGRTGTGSPPASRPAAATLTPAPSRSPIPMSMPGTRSGSPLGWVTFDPTPVSAPARGGAVASARPPAG